MVKPPTPLEQQVAQEYNAERLDQFQLQRARSVLLAVVLGALVGLAILYEQPMIAFNLAMVALIFLIRAWDIHGMVQAIRRRPRKTLVVRMPFIDRETRDKTTSDPGLSP